MSTITEVHVADRSPNHEYWDSFYAGRAASLVPDRPSHFAEWSLDYMAPTQTVVEFGFRRFLDPAGVVAEIEERGEVVTHCMAGHGLAVHKSEDPHVARVVVHWPSQR
jgi:hypothetical protein